jgi:hypothetical protein
LSWAQLKATSKQSLAQQQHWPSEHQERIKHTANIAKNCITPIYNNIQLQGAIFFSSPPRRNQLSDKGFDKRALAPAYFLDPISVALPVFTQGPPDESERDRDAYRDAPRGGSRRQSISGACDKKRGSKSKFCNYLREQLIVTLCVLIISYHVTLFMIPLLHHLDPESEREHNRAGRQSGSLDPPADFKTTAARAFSTRRAIGAATKKQPRAESATRIADARSTGGRTRGKHFRRASAEQRPWSQNWKYFTWKSQIVN